VTTQFCVRSTWINLRKCNLVSGDARQQRCSKCWLREELRQLIEGQDQGLRVCFEACRQMQVTMHWKNFKGIWEVAMLAVPDLFRVDNIQDLLTRPCRVSYLGTRRQMQKTV
jgi:hypothetical protein